MKPEEATRLCIEALRQNVKGYTPDWGGPHKAYDDMATALESGDLRIVNNHHTLMCSDKYCRENALVSCSLLKRHIERLAALEEVAEAARKLSFCSMDDDAYDVLADKTSAVDVVTALAELDALDGGDGT